MGNAQQQTHECHDLASRRQRNREAFSAAVAAFRARPEGLGPLAAGAAAAAGPALVARKRPLFEREAAADFDVLTCCAADGGGPAAVWLSRAMIKADAAHMFVEHHAYAFDATWGEGASTQELYEAHVRPLVTEVQQGGSACVLAFGATGSGKTFTMDGLLAAAASDIGEQPVTVEALEVARDVTDLLHDSAPCTLREDAEGSVHVVGQASPPAVALPHAAAALDALRAAGEARATFATGVHDRSSRTHAVYRLRFGGGLLALVDLAGSEWSRDQSQHSAARRQEAKQVNASLSVLKACLRARELGQKAHAPVREHRLTRLLQDALSGSARAVVVATVSPASADTEHSMDTLAHTCRSVRGGRADLARPAVGQRVITKVVAGRASLDWAEGPPPPLVPRAPGVAGWCSGEVCKWWIEAGEAAALAACADEGEAPRFHVEVPAADWPPGQRLGLAFHPGQSEPVVERVSPALAKRCPLLVPGSRLAAVQGTEGTREELLAALRQGSLRLLSCTELVAQAKQRSAEYERELVRSRPMHPQLAALRAFVVGEAQLPPSAAAAAPEDAQVREEELLPPPPPPPPQPSQEEEEAAVFVLRMSLLEPRDAGDAPPVPRIFTGESRLGEGDGSTLLQMFGSGPEAFVGAGCTPLVARRMFAALQAARQCESQAPSMET